LGTKIGNFVLKKKEKKVVRAKKLFNLESAKVFGVFFNVTDDADFEKVKKLLKDLSAMGKNVFALGYVPKKEVPQQYLMLQKINFFAKKDLNWYGKPQIESVEEFINKDFDVLIDLNFKPSFVSEWVLRLSRAKLKIGKQQDDIAWYDFMITTTSNDIKYFNEQVIFYLEKIKLVN